MNTSTRLSPSAPSPRRRAAARRLLALAGLSLALPLLAACDADSDSPSSVAASATAGAPTPSATSGSVEPSIAANGDPFCDLAVKALDDARATDVTTSEFQTVMVNVAGGTAPIGDLNDWGSTLHDLATSSLKFYDDAVPYVAGTEAEADFAATRGFVNDYSIVLADMARDATDGEVFISDVAAFVQTPEVQSAITTGPDAAQRVAAYIDGRCPAEG